MGLDGKGQEAWWDKVRGARAQYKALRRQRLSVLGPAPKQPNLINGLPTLTRPTAQVIVNAPKTSTDVSSNANQDGIPRTSGMTV